MKILIVDDSRVVRNITQSTLTGHGHEVVTAENGQIALDLMVEGSFELILLDWNMPVLNGPGVLEANQNGKLTSAPIIMMTTESSAETIYRAFDLGASDYIMKPFNEDLLLEKVNELS